MLPHLSRVTALSLLASFHRDLECTLLIRLKCKPFMLDAAAYYYAVGM